MRGNHDLGGPAVPNLPRFTGTPNDRFYYGFRSGPVAALVVDTGEDKPDDSEVFGGMVAFQKMSRLDGTNVTEETMKGSWRTRVVRGA